MAAQGWWQAADGYWYPPQARPGQLWQGDVIGPHGEQPPGPGWWLASDYQWYPPDARPGEYWRDPVAATGTRLRPAATAPAPMPARTMTVISSGRNDAALIAAAGLVLIILGVVLLTAVRALYPDATTALRLMAWLPVGAGSSVILIGAMRYLGMAE